MRRRWLSRRMLLFAGLLIVAVQPLPLAVPTSVIPPARPREPATVFLVDGLAALLWPTQGTLGRKEIAGSANAETVRRAIGAAIQELHTFPVERTALERLHVTLDRIYQDNVNTVVQSYGMTFVHHPQPYTYWSNSNHMTAQWMNGVAAAFGVDPKSSLDADLVRMKTLLETSRAPHDAVRSDMTVSGREA